MLLLLLAVASAQTVFTMEWSREYCSGHHCRAPPQAKLTIHGLWPNIEQRNCSRFNAASLKPILPLLKTDWPSYSETDLKFWAHEWYKHGSCMGLTTLEYFKRALELYSQFNTALVPGDVSPTSYFLGALQSRYRGILPRIVCIHNYLYEIEICLDDFLGPINCTMQIESCREVRIK